MNNKLINTNGSLAELNTSHGIIIADKSYFSQVKKNTSVSVFGDIATVLEENSDKINEITRHIAEIAANSNDERIVRNYEDNCNFIEKYFKTNELNYQSLQRKREIGQDTTIRIIEYALKGGMYGIKKGLSMIDRKKAYGTIWKLCCLYANWLDKNTNSGDLGAKTRVERILCNLSQELYGKYRLRETVGDIKDLGKLSLPREPQYRENIVILLHMLYSEKHAQRNSAEYKEKDLDDLASICSCLGFVGDISYLIKKYEAYNQPELSDFGRMSKVIHSIYQEGQYALNLNTGYANEIELRLRDYVPNGDRQRLTRMGTNLLTTAGITAAGVLTENPALLMSGCTMAASMIQNASGEDNANTLANILAEAGLNDSEQIKKCITDARKNNKKELVQKN